MRRFPAAILTCLLLCAFATHAAESRPATGTQQIPARELRGFGKLSGTFTRLPGGVSHLEIDCESEEKARIVHAKYINDLKLFQDPQTRTLAIGGTKVPIAIVPHAAITAFRDRKAVHMVIGPEETALAKALETLRSSLRSAELTPSGAVPMYLGAFENNGFRFYYGGFEVGPNKPGEQKEWPTFDAMQTFEFAKKNNCGMICWDNPSQVDMADGTTNEPMWSWAAHAMELRKIPFVLNTYDDWSTWIATRFCGETQARMPDYVGGFYYAGNPGFAGCPRVSWASERGQQAVASVLQKDWRKYAAKENTIEYLEPHGEIGHGDHDILIEYGPVADRSYRGYLKEKYKSLDVLNKRWHGDAKVLRSWDDVRVPEVASFFGFDKDALDLAGDWRVDYPSDANKDSWFQPTTKDDDWGTLRAPDSDEAILVDRRPQLWRRHFDVPAQWKAAHPRAWLYVFSLNETAPAFMNGQKLEPLPKGLNNWMVAEVTASLKPGSNLLALTLPSGYLGYKVYLTGREPKPYPHLGKEMNARWVDLINWHTWVRIESVRRYVEAIREVDPDRNILLMAPHCLMLKSICEDYGARLHDTGFMAGCWNQVLSLAMSSRGMPVSAEPGGPAADLAGFKFFLGNWLTEGLSAIHYFGHINDVYFNDQIRPWFEANNRTVTSVGKSHRPRSKVGVICDSYTHQYFRWPFDRVASGALLGYDGAMRNDFETGGLTFEDFKRGTADDYRVILDTNTVAFTEEMVDDVMAWVRKGGVFIALTDTGSFSPEDISYRPIERLTGFELARMRNHPEWVEQEFAPDQKVFKPAEWTTDDKRRVGAELKAVEQGCEPLTTWPTGNVAIGMRKLGDGYVIHLGSGFRQTPVRQIFEWLKLEPVPATSDIVTTHQISNNGLYDVWILYNNDGGKERKTKLRFRPGFKPDYCFDYQSGQRIALKQEGEQLCTDELDFKPLDTRILVTPRPDATLAALEWFDLQCCWWQGATKPRGKTPEYKSHTTMNLTEGWKMKSLEDADQADQTPLAAPTQDDASWKKADLLPYLVPDDSKSSHAFYRKEFTVPAQWNKGEIELWAKSWHTEMAWGPFRVWLDGAEIHGPCGHFGPLNLTDKLAPGSKHLLALETRTRGSVAGITGNLYFVYMRKPDVRIDLAGEWIPREGETKWGKPIQLPGPWACKMAKRTILIDKKLAGKTVMMRYDASDRCYVNGVMVNGRYQRRLHHMVGPRTYLNITPWVKFGEENEVCIVGGGGVQIQQVCLELFDDASEYP